jgi:hypothetical protein
MHSFGIVLSAERWTTAIAMGDSHASQPVRVRDNPIWEK